MLARCTAALAVTPVAAAALRQPAAARAMTTGGFETVDRGLREDKKRGGAIGYGNLGLLKMRLSRLIIMNYYSTQILPLILYNQ